VRGKCEEESLMRVVMASRQVSWLLRTFRKREDLKETVINTVSQGISKLSARTRIPRDPRPTMARNQPVIAVDKKAILRISAFVSL